jgi:hypothetical protein
MKKFFLVLASAAVLLGSVPIGAEAADSARTFRHDMRHARVCRVVKVKRVVWRYHRRYVTYYKVRRCRWV